LRRENKSDTFLPENPTGREPKRKEKGVINQSILPLVPAGATPINEILSVWRDEDRWTYFIGSHPVYSHGASDLRMFRLTAAQLIATGNCRACEIIKTFGVSKSSVDRAVRRYREGGAEAFFERRHRHRSGTVMTSEVLCQAQRMLDAYESRRTVADELEVSYAALVKAIQDGRLHEPDGTAPGAAKSDRNIKDAEAAEGMGTACTRPGERILAALGLLDGAQIRFEPCRDVPYGGILCALPALLSNGLLSGIGTLGKLGGYYHGLHVLLLLAFMAMARIKTAESLRGKAPGEFGKLIGLDRIPEVRCLRKKMDQLSRDESAERWAVALGRAWMEAEPESVGTLYIDGHMRVYHGHKTKPPRKFVSRQRLCLRGVNDYWVNDAIGRPFFVIEKVVDPGMLKVLREDIVPRLLNDVPHQPSQEQLDADPYLSRFILVFDREGYSPVFFRDMWRDHRIGCITYHKHPAADWSESEFTQQTVSMPRGETLTMMLAEKGSLVGTNQDAVWLREVRKLTKSGHQTSLISTAYGLEHTVLAARMFTRWCQENFFGYMMDHFAIDILNEYSLEDLPDTEQVVNPLWRDLNRQRNSLQSKLKTRQVRFAELTLHPAAEDEPSKITLWKSRKAALLEEIQGFEREIADLKSRIKGTDKHIQWDQLDDKDRFKKPAVGRKRLMDSIRMIAYRAETAMAMLMTSPTIDTAAARRLLQDLFATEADIFPDLENRRLLVSVHRGSRPAVNQALSKLFEHLNASETIYPGSDLRLVYNFVGSTEKANGVTSTSPR
jgi:transposase